MNGTIDIRCLLGAERAIMQGNGSLFDGLKAGSESNGAQHGRFFASVGLQPLSASNRAILQFGYATSLQEVGHACGPLCSCYVAQWCKAHSNLSQALIWLFKATSSALTETSDQYCSCADDLLSAVLALVCSRSAATAVIAHLQSMFLAKVFCGLLGSSGCYSRQLCSM